MSNGINNRQNEEKCIKMLAAQRTLYSKAKHIDSFAFTLSVVIPLIFSFFEIFIDTEVFQTILYYFDLSINSDVFCFVSYSLTVVLIVVSHMLDDFSEIKRETAAYIQQKFDTYVYNMNWNNLLFGNNRNADEEIETYSNRIFNNPRKKEELKNWYSPNVDSKDLKHGILLCQKENIRWDKNLRKRFIVLIKIITIIICSIVIILGFMKKDDILKCISRFAFIAPLLDWLYSSCKKIQKDIIMLKELQEIVDNDSDKQMSDLQEIQKLIYEHRKDNFIIPDWFYKLFKNSDESLSERINNN